MNDSENEENEKPIPKDSINKKEENPPIEPENNIENLEENYNNKEKENIQENNNQNNEKEKDEDNDDFNKNNEFPNENTDNFDDNIQNINNKIENKENKNNIDDFNDDKKSNISKENQNNINDNNKEQHNNYKEGEENNNNENNDNIKEEKDINPDEKIDESSNFEKNNIRFSSLRKDERNSNVNIENNEPSGFIYDEENPYNNKDNETENKLNVNTKQNNTGNLFDFDKHFSNNFKDENEFEFDDDKNNMPNNNNNYQNNNNYNKQNNNNYNSYDNLMNNKNPYETNIPNNNQNNYLRNNKLKYESNVNHNQTESNLIPQEVPIIGTLNYQSYPPPPPTIQSHHPDYEPLFEKYEEFPEDGDGQSMDPNKKGKDSTRTSGAQIANTIMGAGILSIPIIMRYLGFIIGIFLILFLALSTIYSVYILIRCHEITGKNGYSMFAKITMGRFGSILIKIIIIINNIGLCIAYFRIFGEVVQTIVQGWVSPDSFWATNWHNFIYILMCGIIMIFFIFKENLSSLKRVAYLGVFAVFIFAVSLTVLLAYKTSKDYLENDISWDYLIANCTFSEAFHAVPTVFLAFLFQFNVFPIYLSLKHKNMESMMKATKIGVGYSLIFFLIVGIIGFLLYGFNMEDTILNSFNDDMIKYKNTSTFIKVLIIIICVSFVTTCLTSFPILFLSLKENFINSLLFCAKNCGKNKNDEKIKINKGIYEKKENYNYINNKAIIAITLILYFLILSLSIIMPKLKIIFSIVGATAGTFIAFILPNLFYIRICKMSNKNYNIALPLIFFAFGLFVLIISIVVTFI